MNTKSIITILVVVVLVIIGFFVFNSQQAVAPVVAPDETKGDEMDEMMEGEEGMMDNEEMMGGEETAASEQAVKEFALVGTPFQFSVKEIRVSKGDTVRVNFENGQGTHDWTIDEFNAKTPVIQAGEKATVEFVADKTGQFEYYCSVGNHRALGMVGKLIVE
ncbi:MAG: cupredoxin domain-containing protein [Candidatus Doudnabacteria bacterium]|nr:cupredoxin domain-containing protein [Candidatus Doudnabacteria bacterium]